MIKRAIHTLDLNFMGIPGTIACYLIPHKHGALLVECGPGSTQNALVSGLKDHNLTPADISDVFLTHIHLDHAGAAGWLAKQGARVHVHPVGAPHMLNPEKLLASAGRIYGDMMETLWGEFLPVPDEQLSILKHEEVVEVYGLRLRAIETTGHADHHFAYLFEDVLFSGDIGGVRLAGTHHIRLPMPPPEFHLEKWAQSVKRLKGEKFTRIAPTHFSIHDDADWHMSALEQALSEVNHWLESTMPNNPSMDELNAEFLRWTAERATLQGVDQSKIDAYETANPSWMSTHGILRYWRKYRDADNGN